MLRKDQSGFAHAAATAFGTLVVIAITWSILGPSLEKHVFGYVENQVENGAYDYKPTASLIHYTWLMWPILLLIAAIIYLFMAPHEKVYNPYYGG